MTLRILYTLVWHLALPLIGLRLLWRARRQPEYLQHVGERFGRYPDRVAGPVIWLHAVSVGETRAAAPLIHALLAAHPDCRLLLTHMTPTGRATGVELFGALSPRVRSVYLPYDLPWAMQRFLKHFRPRLGILMETELWPNLIEACHQRHIPLALVNGRLSERSARGYARIGTLARDAFAHLSAIGAQTEADAQRMTALGARYLSVTGNIKFDIAPPPAMDALGATFRNRIGPRQILLAASTREGEEEPLLEAFARLAGPEVLLLLVPRHPQRFGEVERLVQRCGLTLQLRSQAVPVMADTRVWLGDSMGEMHAYYGAAHVALIGGSWKELGGQNPIEACQMGCPVIVGPHTFNFKAVCEQAIEAGAALRAGAIEEGLKQALLLLDTPTRRASMGAAGREFAQSHRGATARTVTLLMPLYRGSHPQPGQ
ncbi:lipid IV(A) 3-deoxy-D-manno-octulosonic acid transferase [Zoogloea sp.]|uniref:lipid IV(A) 3-deoxy-D-manno-octulosonic acid transferase n=1 Tax=Zoogloea sp. TaxID=49181 RepID=UPI00260B2D6F|nr:lipid IV(A) 3-deoxy-D-manno-octulosonic acid transferase [Zoogloea sp.]MDD3352221.1 lipid IV(A) 3-deoxy-D-manno-octulosonic acid transferase [Zoogloea sp.]